MYDYICRYILHPNICYIGIFKQEIFDMVPRAPVSWPGSICVFAAPRSLSPRVEFLGWWPAAKKKGPPSQRI